MRVLKMIVSYGAAAGALSMLLAGAALAQKAPPAPKAGQTTVIKIGTTPVKVPAPDGFCFMDRVQNPDARVYQLVQATLGTTNTLFTVLTECDQLTKWRTGKQKTLDDMIQVQSLTRALNTSIPQDRSAIAKQLCKEMGALSKDKTNKIFAKKRDLVSKLSKSIRINETKFLGPLETGEDACYAGLIQGLKTEVGTQKILLVLFATTVIKKKLFYYYRYQVYSAPEQLKPALEKIKADTKAIIAANGG